MSIKEESYSSANEFLKEDVKGEKEREREKGLILRG